MAQDKTARRRFLKNSLLAGLAIGTSGCSSFAKRASPLPPLEEEVPDFSEANVLRQVAGIRPYRKDKFRLEFVRSGQKSIVHNYGHGGAGFTMSWGCAEIAAEWIAPFARPGDEVAVLGGGVIGLTTARMLIDRGLRPRIYAAAFAPEITSYFAGAQWGPAIVSQGETDREKEMFVEILRRSYRRYERMDGFRYGVSHRLNYADEEGDRPLDRLPGDLLPAVRDLDRLPFPGKAHKGKQYRTLFIEPPVFLQAITRELKDRNVIFEKREFASEADVHSLTQTCIVNCMGLGARRVYNDDLLVGVRGQLVHLNPKPLPWLLIHRDGYIFPRSDAIVLGGTFEKGIEDTTPDPTARVAILDGNRRFFYD
jgi:glycine/D-amino acid oxidase-like deaminating enzyme